MRKIKTECELLKLEGVREFVRGDLDFYNLSEIVQDILYEFYCDKMPYGIAKARTGDPDVWIAERLERLL